MHVSERNLSRSAASSARPVKVGAARGAVSSGQPHHGVARGRHTWAARAGV